MPKEIYRLNIPIQSTKNSPNHIGQLGFGYRIDEISWKVKTYFGVILTIYNDEINSIFEKVNLNNINW